MYWGTVVLRYPALSAMYELNVDNRACEKTVPTEDGFVTHPTVGSFRTAKGGKRQGYIQPQDVQNVVPARSYYSGVTLLK